MYPNFKICQFKVFIFQFFSISTISQNFPLNPITIPKITLCLFIYLFFKKNYKFFLKIQAKVFLQIRLNSDKHLILAIFPFFFFS
jgi:hypothetical protein